MLMASPMRAVRTGRGTWQTAFSIVFRDAGYRAIFIELLVVGLGTGLVAPYMAMWVVESLHGTTAKAAFLFVPQGVLSVVVNLLAAAHSDRAGQRKPVMLAGMAVGALAWMGLSVTSSYDMALIFSALTGMSLWGLVYALLGDIMAKRAHQSPAVDASAGLITAIERTAFSLGFLTGPVVGGLLLSRVGFSGLFVAAGALALMAVAWGWWQVEDATPQVSHDTGGVRAPMRPRDYGVVAVLGLVGLLIFAGDTGRMTFLPLYLTGSLHLPVAAVSWAFSATVLAEFVFMPLAGAMADRFGVPLIFLVGIASQALYFFGVSIAHAYWAILLLQVLYAFVVSTSMGVAIVFAQRVMAGARMGLTTTTYLVSRGVAPMVNTLLITLVALRLNHMFLVLGLLALGALALVLVITRIQQRSGISSASVAKNG
jgi:SET family sugar efflux transporter-like MFS transporter